MCYHQTALGQGTLETIFCSQIQRTQTETKRFGSSCSVTEFTFTSPYAFTTPAPASVISIICRQHASPIQCPIQHSLALSRMDRHGLKYGKLRPVSRRYKRDPSAVRTTYEYVTRNAFVCLCFLQRCCQQLSVLIGPPQECSELGQSCRSVPQFKVIAYICVCVCVCVCTHTIAVLSNAVNC